MIGKHTQSQISKKPPDRRRAEAGVGAQGAEAVDRFGISTTAMVPATVDFHSERGRAQDHTEDIDSIRGTHTASGGVDHTSPDRRGVL